ncbi:hypothetical protein BBJ29_006390 [Phytophthora kernoviae]|uniref:Phytanoyl-CoA dioxygenase n=1 Tax=Phytophthora kernoviae TaxID=325452 RepID=A0A3F2RTE0_9STRA|nr:hypothetical protein BBJ29_006390 [Phytophthora kernoviae]RLN62859.1 hypothetical protein BBP00_00004499 [Phytophthora kernoviae]
MTPRLKQALDQICGEGRWEEFGLGWWMITFPDQAEPPWGAAGKWHVDGASYQHHVDSAESGLLMIFLFSDIGPGEGGTAVSAESHKWIARLLEKNEPRGMKGGAVSYQARQFERRKVVEVNGKAGDVMLVHPFLLHARSKNLGQKGVESVRIMCNPNMLRRQPTRVEERADVAAEYEGYLQEKENKTKNSPQLPPTSSFDAPSGQFRDPITQREDRRRDMRARIGLDVQDSN